MTHPASFEGAIVPSFSTLSLLDPLWTAFHSQYWNSDNKSFQPFKALQLSMLQTQVATFGDLRVD
jgi:hypothetical protein